MMKSSDIRAKISKTNFGVFSTICKSWETDVGQTQSEHRRQNNSTLMMKA